MNLSKRQRRIVEMLFERKHEATVAEIAHRIHVSPRTIHRELAEIETVLRHFGIVLLKKTGVGVQVLAAPEQLERAQAELFRAEAGGYSQEERRVLILCSLLEQAEPIKLFSLAHELQAAIPTVSGDLDELEAWVERNGLRLVRRRGYGVEIAGTEADKRAAIAVLAEESLDISALFSSASESSYDIVSRRLLAMVGKENFIRLEKALWKLEETYPTTLSEDAYTSLLIRLSIALTRYHAGNVLTGDRGQAAGGKATALCRELYDRLAAELELRLPDPEKLAMMELFQDWEDAGQAPHNRILYEDFHQLEFVTRLIQAVGGRMGVDFRQDRSLKEGLLEHVARTMNRMLRGERIRNPLLPEIRKDYETLFAAVRSALRQLPCAVDMPDEEVGYLTLHFGAALERTRRLTRKVRALLVCTNGIGSSKLLAVRIEKELPEIELLARISWFEAARVPNEDYDLIISTVDLPLPPDQYFKASPLLTKEEAEKLRLFIRNRTFGSEKTEAEDAERPGDAAMKLNDTIQYSQICVKLLNHFEIYDMPSSRYDAETDLHTLVMDLLAPIESRFHQGGAEEVASLLLRRERQGSLVIPGSKLALLHTRAAAVRDPFFSLFRFDGPVKWPADAERMIQRILLMLGPITMDKRTQTVLSEVSAMLLEPGVIDRLETEDGESIKRMFSRKFERFLKTQLE